MITGGIKNKVDKIWTDIWAGGITNPLTVIEQLTYLMFIRSLDEKELEIEQMEHDSGMILDKIFPPSAVGQSMRWSKFKNNDPRSIYDVISQRVFPAIKNMAASDVYKRQDACRILMKRADWSRLPMIPTAKDRIILPFPGIWATPCS